MEFARAGRMRIAACERRTSARTARGAGEIGSIKSETFGRETVDVRRVNVRMAIRSAVVPGHVIGDENDDVGGRGASLGDADSRRADQHRDGGYGGEEFRPHGIGP